MVTARKEFVTLVQREMRKNGVSYTDPKKAKAEADYDECI